MKRRKLVDTPHEAARTGLDLVLERDRVLGFLTNTEFASPHHELPDRPGLYAFWAESYKAFADLGLEEVQDQTPLSTRPLYVGKAEDSIFLRVAAKHLVSGATGHSTARRTFAALLDLQSRPRRSRIAHPTPKQMRTMAANFDLTEEDDAHLTDWMLENLAVRAATSNWAPLRDLERAVGVPLRPPLDQERPPMWGPNPWRDQVKMARRRLQARARGEV